MAVMRPLVLLVLVAGCGEETPPPVEPWVEVGAGRDTYRPLHEHDSVELVFGPQGGWHVDLGARFGGLAPEGMVLIYRVRDELGDVGYPVKLHFAGDDVTPLGDGSYERVGDRVIMSISAAEEVVGKRLWAEAQVIQNGAVLSDEEHILIVDELP